MCTPTQGVWQPAGCVSCELVCVCVSFVRVVIICLASTHTALVSSPSLAVLHLSTYLLSFAPDYATEGCQHADRILRRLLSLLSEFAERRKFYTEYVHFWSLEYGVFHGIRGIRVEYGWNTGLWEVIWNTWKTYSDSRPATLGLARPHALAATATARARTAPSTDMSELSENSD